MGSLEEVLGTAAAGACERMLRVCCYEQEALVRPQTPTPSIIKIASGFNVLSQMPTPNGTTPSCACTAGYLAHSMG